MSKVKHERRDKRGEIGVAVIVVKPNPKGPWRVKLSKNIFSATKKKHSRQMYKSHYLLHKEKKGKKRRFNKKAGGCVGRQESIFVVEWRGEGSKGEKLNRQR